MNIETIILLIIAELLIITFSFQYGFLLGQLKEINIQIKELLAEYHKEKNDK